MDDTVFYYYDRQGKPFTDNKMLPKLREEKVVKQDYTKNSKYWVSTVWLCIDHDFNWLSTNKPNPRPLIFETMVFERNEDGSTNYADLDMNRYRTEKEALKGHRTLLAKWNR